MSAPHGSCHRSGTAAHKQDTTLPAALTLQAWLRQRLESRRAHRLLLWLHLLRLVHEHPTLLCASGAQLSTSLADAAVLQRLVHAVYAYEAAVDTENYTRALLLEELMCQSDVVRGASAHARWQLRQRHPAVRRQAISSSTALQVLKESHVNEPLPARQAIPLLLRELELFLGPLHFEWWRCTVADTDSRSAEGSANRQGTPAVHHDAAADTAHLHQLDSSGGSREEGEGGEQARLRALRPARLHEPHSSEQGQRESLPHLHQERLGTANTNSNSSVATADGNAEDNSVEDDLPYDAAGADGEDALNAAYAQLRAKAEQKAYAAAEQATLAGCPLAEAPVRSSQIITTAQRAPPPIPALAATADEDQYLTLVRQPVLGTGIVLHGAAEGRSDAIVVVDFTNPAAAAATAPVCVVCELDGTLATVSGDGNDDHDLLLPCFTCKGLVHACCACQSDRSDLQEPLQHRRIFCCSHCRTAAA